MSSVCYKQDSGQMFCRFKDMWFVFCSDQIAVGSHVHRWKGATLKLELTTSGSTPPLLLQDAKFSEIFRGEIVPSRV
jgi:hypothetical protein